MAVLVSLIICVFAGAILAAGYGLGLGVLAIILGLIFGFGPQPSDTFPWLFRWVLGGAICGALWVAALECLAYR